MELKDFVAQTITEITQGIIEAQEENKGTDLIVAPHLLHDGAIANEAGKPEKPSMLHFDINIAASSSEKEGGGGGKFSLKVISFGIGMERNDGDMISNENIVTQRISFDLPIVWPTKHTQKEPRAGFGPLPNPKNLRVV